MNLCRNSLVSEWVERHESEDDDERKGMEDFSMDKHPVLEKRFDNSTVQSLDKIKSIKTY